MELSIIIVNYNVKQLVLECIRSIYTYLKCASFEVIVVDNNSNDNSVNSIKDAFPGVVVIGNDINEGFSKGNNQGIEIAKGDYVLLLNPDTYLFDDSLCKLIDFIKRKDSTILAAPKLLNTDKSVQYSAWKDKNLLVMLQESFRFFQSSYPLETSTTPQIVENVSGAAMFFQKNLITKIGYFDEEMFYMEDFDFCYRARKAGVPAYYYPNSSIVHYGGQSSKKNVEFAYANSIISKLKFYKKHHSVFSIVIVHLLTLFHLVAYILFLLLVFPFSRYYREKISPSVYTLRKLMVYFFTNNAKGLIQ